MADDKEKINQVSSETPLINAEAPKKQRKSKKGLKDPVLVQSVDLHQDIYALTWNALRTSSWENLDEVYGQKISLTNGNISHLLVVFIVFILIVLSTVGILLVESFITDAYHDADWPIIVLRLTLVAFAQKKLEPELYQGFALRRYTSKNKKEFIMPCFAQFVTICQIFVAFITFMAIFLFVCMANEALELIMNFAGLAVISELDDWVGSQIMSESITRLDQDEDNELEYNDKEKYELKTEDLNERLSLFSKLCLIGEDMQIEDDQNSSKGFFSALSDYIPWTLVPLLTLPCQYILLHIQGYAIVATK